MNIEKAFAIRVKLRVHEWLAFRTLDPLDWI